MADNLCVLLMSTFCGCGSLVIKYFLSGLCWSDRHIKTPIKYINDFGKYTTSEENTITWQSVLLNLNICKTVKRW